jgi:hypothetical protein
MSALDPSDQSRQHEGAKDGGVPTSLAQGVCGAGPVNETEANATRYVNQESGTAVENENVNAEQMATLSEGKVAGAVKRKGGSQKTPGGQPDGVTFDDYAADLDR